MTRRIRRRIFVGPAGTAPKRIPLDVLEQLARQLRMSLDRVAADLGSQPGQREIELVDLVSGSAGLVLEESLREDAPSSLALTVDALAALTVGNAPPAILTPEAMVAIDELYDACRTVGGRGWPVRVEPRAADDVVGAAVPFGLVAIPPLDEAEEPTREQRGEEQEQSSDDVTPTLPAPEWLIEFDAVVVRLDKPASKMWAHVDGTLVSALRLRRDLFEAVDADDARWKRVRVVARGDSPHPTANVEVLHLAPASVASATVTTPLDEAAKRLRDVLDRIRGFENLPPRWDSYQSQPIKPVAIRAASEFLIIAEADARGRGRMLPLPFAAPTSRGGVHLEWERDDLFLAIEFLGREAIESVRAVGEETVEGPGTRASALNLIVWLLARWTS